MRRLWNWLTGRSRWETFWDEFACELARMMAEPEEREQVERLLAEHERRRRT